MKGDVDLKKILCILLSALMCSSSLQLVEAKENNTVDGVAVVTEDNYQPVSKSVSDNMEDAAMGSGMKKDQPKVSYYSRAAITSPYWNLTSGNKLFYDANGKLMFNGPSKMILDVSSWQGKINWDKVKASGIDGVILRVGWGYLGEDAQFKRNLSECNRLGIPYGIYLYSYAYDANFAYAEAEGTAQMLAGLDLSNLKYPIYYDIENFDPWKDDNGAIRRPPTTVRGYEQIISTYINRMNQLGYQGKVHVYSYRSYLQSVLNSSKILSYTSWIAAYTNTLGYTNKYYNGSYGWQYTSSGSVDGISGNVDMSAFSSDQIIISQPQSVTLSVTSLSLPVGKTQTVSAKVNPSQFVSQNVMWSSDNPGVASVDQNGTIHANKAGTATITAYATNKVSAAVKVTVTASAPAPKITLTSSKTLYKGKTTKLNGSASNGAALSWSSSNNAVATVDSSGQVKAVKAGTAYVTASINGASAQCKITVKDPVIKLNKSSATTYKGKKYTLKASTSYATKVSWKTSNSKIATVNSSGVVTPKKTGKVTISATAYGKKATCKITVKNPSVSLNKKSATVYKGSKYTLKASASYSTKVTWKSSNNKIATVSSKGVVTPKKAGKVTITASAFGKKVTCKVTVKNPTLSVNKTKISLKRKKSYTVKAKAVPNKKISWSSKNKNIATVNSKGKITGKKKGTTYIYAKVNGLKKTIKVTVK